MSSQLQQVPGDPSARSYAFGPFRIDRVNRFLLHGGEVVPLTPKAFELLLMLVDRHGDVVEKSELMKGVWADAFVEEGNLSHHVFMLRKHLAAASDGQTYIETIPRRGYRFVAPLRSDETRGHGAWQPTIRRAMGFTAVVAVIGLAAGTSLVRRPAVTRAPELRSIAVLPFASKNESLGVGVADAVTTRLTAMRGVVVRPLTTSQGKETDPVAIARALKVDAIITGSIGTSAGRTRATVSLLRARDGEAIWRGELEEPAANLSAVAERIATGAAEVIRPVLTKREQQELSRRYTGDAEAYRLYLLGQYHVSLAVPADRRRAISFFERAIERDPRFALAHASLANAWVALGVYGVAARREWIQPAEQAAIQSLQLDGNLSEAQTALSAVRIYGYNDWRSGERGTRRAIQLNPGNILAYRQLAHVFQITGRFDEAIAMRQHVVELDPLSPVALRELGMTYYMARRYEAAIRTLTEALQMEPTFALSLVTLGKAYVQSGRLDLATAALEKAAELSNSANARAWLAYGYQAAGRKVDAERTAHLIIEESKTRYVSPYNVALAYLACGERDQVLHYLSKAVDEPSQQMLHVKTEPAWDPLRGDARFEGLVHRMKLGP